MANKRMFAKEIIHCDEFLDMPLGSQALYFHLGMNADDDGFVQPKSVMRLCQAKDDELKILIAKGFIIPFENLVVVITHWHVNNYLQNDRYKPTIYQELLKQLTKNETKTYAKINSINTLSKLDTECIHDGYSLETQYSIDKIRLDKDKIRIDKQKKEKVEKIEIFNLEDFNEDELAAIKLFIADRKERKNPMTTQSMVLLCTKLKKYKKDKVDIIDAVNFSIEKAYTSVYPSSEYKKPNNNKSSKREENSVPLRSNDQEYKPIVF